MSTEAVKKFWQKAQQDSALQTKMTAIQEREGQVALAAVIQLAADAGFAFTAAEYEAAIREELARQHAAGELSEEQLQQISGGAGAAAFALLSAKPILSGAACQSCMCDGCPV